MDVNHAEKCLNILQVVIFFVAKIIFLDILASMNYPTHPRKHPFMIIAHRGGAGLAPENTLEAFQAGLAYHPDAVELDIHMSKDGSLVLMHDPLVETTTNGQGEISKKTLDELKLLDASVHFQQGNLQPHRIPVLEEVLAFVGNRALLQIEIKLRSDNTRYPGIELQLIQVLREYCLIEKTTVLSFDFPTLAAVKELEPRLKTCALIGRTYFGNNTLTSPEIASYIASLGVDCIGTDRRFLDDALYNEYRKYGLIVGVWVVNDPEDMKRFASMGVDFITSDRPDLLQKIGGLSS